MKVFLKDYGIAIFNIVLIAGSLIWLLSGEPSQTIQGPGGWLIVRAYTLLYTTIIAVGVFTNWKHFFTGVKALFGQAKQVKSAWANKSLQNINILTWVIWWAVVGQVFTSFFVAEWCVDGF